MKVAKEDPVIHGLLSEEQRRSRKVLQALQAKADKLPKGALNVRRKQAQGKEYLYHYLVRREGMRVVNQHVAERDLPSLREQLAEREKCRAEIRVYKQRLAYLERLLK
jgi:ribosomal protein L10